METNKCCFCKSRITVYHITLNDKMYSICFGCMISLLGKMLKKFSKRKEFRKLIAEYILEQEKGKTDG